MAVTLQQIVAVSGGENLYDRLYALDTTGSLWRALVNRSNAEGAGVVWDRLPSPNQAMPPHAPTGDEGNW